MKLNMKLRKSIAFAALTLLSSFATKDSIAQSSSPIKNIVIVHGAFADASGWEDVYKILKKDGYNVTLVQNPLTSLNDDVQAATRALDRQNGPAVLVGHSWGGSVITQAGVSPKVVSLVYVAAFSPEVGQSTLDVYQSGPALPKNGILPADANGVVYFDKALFHECFSGDVSAAKAAFMYDSQQPIVGACFTAPLTEAAWKTKPSYAIVATEDKAINPVLERAMYKKIGAKVTEVKASHVVYISQPAAVAKVIEEAAKAGVNK